MTPEIVADQLAALTTVQQVHQALFCYGDCPVCNWYDGWLRGLSDAVYRYDLSPLPVQEREAAFLPRAHEVFRGYLYHVGRVHISRS